MDSDNTKEIPILGENPNALSDFGADTPPKHEEELVKAETIMDRRLKNMGFPLTLVTKKLLGEVDKNLREWREKDLASAFLPSISPLPANFSNIINDMLENREIAYASEIEKEEIQREIEV